jgi:tRNA A-37 threonylcarbamoyl transferase component Bud32
VDPRTRAPRGTPGQQPRACAAPADHAWSEPTTRARDDAGLAAVDWDCATGVGEPTERRRGYDDDLTTIRPAHLRAGVGGSSPRGGRRRRGRVGKYLLLDRLGSGGFGVVFMAHDPSLDRDVAIKMLHPSHLTNAAVVRRFLQEARATARIAHPGIVTIHDCGLVETRHGVTAFIAMELLGGETLASRLGRGTLEPATAAELARQVASALAAAHRADVVHRDLKPANIYLVPDPAMPSGERVKVLDFGLAKLGTEGGTDVQTVFGTAPYMSPEQRCSTAQVDARTDIYALGCILFELITGRTPFAGDPVRSLAPPRRFGAPPASALAPGPRRADHGDARQGPRRSTAVDGGGRGRPRARRLALAARRVAGPCDAARAPRIAASDPAGPTAADRAPWAPRAVRRPGAGRRQGAPAHRIAAPRIAARAPAAHRADAGARRDPGRSGGRARRADDRLIEGLRGHGRARAD